MNVSWKTMKIRLENKFIIEMSYQEFVKLTSAYLVKVGMTTLGSDKAI